jgi:hypothetical protein
MFWLVIEQGEEQKKLDVLSNEVFIKALASNGRHRMISPCPLAIVMSASVRRLSQKKIISSELVYIFLVTCRCGRMCMYAVRSCVRGSNVRGPCPAWKVSEPLIY